MKRILSLATALVVAIAGFSAAPAFADHNESIPGILIKEAVHELPAPDVAIASDGRSLVVWQDDADPTDGLICTQSGGDCGILAMEPPKHVVHLPEVDPRHERTVVLEQIGHVSGR